MPDIPFCPLQPTEKQRLFYDESTKELFFGGAAGGGKSIALLMAALKYIEQPGYAALIIRKDLPRLELPGGLIPRSHEWFSGLAKEGVRWNAARRTWTFPTSKGARPATITFGFLARPLDKYRYASSEFQYIAFDELTDFLEEDYLFLFSRLRMTHVSNLTLRMRGASNPGGIGRLWVKRRFIDGAASDNMKVRLLMKDGRGYIPSRIDDNPHLHAEAYRDSLSHLPPVEREQLLSGDWDIQPDGVFKQAWLRYFVQTPGQVELLRADGRSLATIADELRSFDRFITIDPAGTPEDEARRRSRGKEASWSVIQVWDQPKQHRQFLLLRDLWRERVDFADLCDWIGAVADEWQVQRIYIEREHTGRAIMSHFKHTRPILGLPAGDGKEARSIPLQHKLQGGQIFFPRDNNSWLAKLEAELLNWTGSDRQPADQIDAAAYAAIIAQQDIGGTIRMQAPVVRG